MKKPNLTLLLTVVSIGAVAFLTACAPSYDPAGVRVTMVITDAGTFTDLQFAKNAAEQWSKVCGVDIQVVYDPFGTWKLGYDKAMYTLNIPLQKVSDIQAMFPDKPADTRGVTTRDADDTPTAVYYDARSPYEEKGAIIGHEFGHVLGFHQHMDSGIMEAHPGTMIVTPATCQALFQAQVTER